MYDFRTLSPLDFEELARDLLQAEFGILFESFGPGRDLGIDFRFATANGSAIVQAKHYTDSRIDALLRTARTENDKVARLKPVRYIFITSASLSPTFKSRLKEAMPAAPLAVEDILGRADINNLLGRHPDIHKKHFKLWLASTEVLERILHSGVYNRTQAEMDVIKAVVPKFVSNDSVPEAEAILQRNGALIIAGEPGVGKSTLARMLVWMHAGQGWKISVIDDIGEAFSIASGDEKRLVFFDDFLGQIRLSDDLIRGTDQRFPPFLHRVKTNKNIRFILTTRDYILRQAQAKSSRLSAATVNATQFTLNVGHYTRATRAQLLFNHVYFADISLDERKSLLADDFFLTIIDHRNFNPRLIDLLTSAEYVSIANAPIRDTVQKILDNPHELWEKPYRSHITEEGRGLMLALFFNENRVALPALERAFDRMIRSMGLSFARADIPVRFRAALKELEGSVFAIEDRHVRFANPGIRDFLERAVLEDGFFPTAIEAACEFAEIKATWDLYCTHTRWMSAEDTDTTVWDAAIARLADDASGTALQRLILSKDMYDRLQSDTNLHFVSTCIQNLRCAEIDGDDLDLCRRALEDFVVSMLPDEILAEARDVLSSSVANMLSNCGDILSFEDIGTVTSALNAHGTDASAATRASRTALWKHTRDLSDTLYEYGSVEDLDNFETELKTLMDRYGVPLGDVAEQIEVRRETLIEREAVDDGEEYVPIQSTTSVESSTDQIRSLFAGLKT